MGFLESNSFTNVPTIPEYYKGKTVFITGGTGFMGKVLIEKLLHACTDLDKIYLLIRSKKDKNPEERLNKLFASPCFDRLRNDKPGVFESKVFIVSGDVSEPRLGLSEKDRIMLIDSVDIIFNVAASVRFDDTLPQAVKLNLLGTRELVELAKDMKHLSSFVHVSTGYSNCNHAHIEEKIYPPHADWRKTIEICEGFENKIELQALTAKYMGEIPNTYVFTKQLAEHVVYEQKGKLPVVILRPSIVVGAIDEPKPGWMDNLNGPAAILVVGGKGLLRSICMEGNVRNNCIPVDYCIKSLIITSWVRGNKKLEASDEVTIYNNCNTDENGLSNRELMDIGFKNLKNIPFDTSLGYPSTSMTTSQLWNTVQVLFLQWIPALLIDTILWLLGKKTILVKVQRRMFISFHALQYFYSRKWKFDITNSSRLTSLLRDQDVKEFYFDIKIFDKDLFYYNCIWATRKYIFMEKDEDIPQARINHKRLKMLDMVIKMIFYGFLVYIFKTIYYAYN